MAEKRDYYEVLGVNKNASSDDIKKAYRKKAIELHPDKQQGKTDEEKKQAEELFKELAEANEILSNTEKRAEYDQFGFNGRNGQGFGMNMDDIMAEMVRNMNPFGHRNAYKQQMSKGRDIRITLFLTLEEVFNGTKKVGKYKRHVKCPDCNGKGAVNENDIKVCPYCNGTGMYREVIRQGNMAFQSEGPCPHCQGQGSIISNPCSKCNGSGLIVTDENIEITVPKGVEDNMVITYQGLGHMPNTNGIPGDLFVVIKINEHDIFDKRGSNLYVMKEISVVDSILGTNSVVESIDGNVYKFKIRQGTMNGEQYRIAGKGLPIINTDKRGDLIVIVKQVMPKSLTNEETELLTKLKEMPHFKNNDDE